MAENPPINDIEFNEEIFKLQFMNWISSEQFRSNCRGVHRRNLMETAYNLRKIALCTKGKNFLITPSNSDIRDDEIDAMCRNVEDTAILTDVQFRSLISFLQGILDRCFVRLKPSFKSMFARHLMYEAEMPQSLIFEIMDQA